MTTYDDAKAALAELLKGGEAFKITPQLLRDSLIALAESIRLVEEDAGTAGAAIAAHDAAADPHPQYTTQAEAEAIATAAANVVKQQLLGGDVAAALDTLLELANQSSTDHTQLLSLVAAVAGKQPLDQDLTDIAALSRAKGTLIVGGASAWSLLGASTDGYVLTLDAAQPSGVKWAAGGVASVSIPNVTFNTGGVIAQITAAAATDKPLVIKGAAGQTANLIEFQNSAGTVLMGLATNGDWYGHAVVLTDYAYCLGVSDLTHTFNISANSGSFGSGFIQKWSSTGVTSGTKDLGLGRSGAGVAEINDGTAGNLRDLKLRNLIFSDGSVLGARAESVQLAMPSAGGWTTFAHGLGETPKKYGAYVICVTASNGYAVGDVVSLPTDNGYTLLNTVAANATSVRFGMSVGTLYVGDGSTGAFANIAGSANFKLVIWAEK